MLNIHLRNGLFLRSLWLLSTEMPGKMATTTILGKAQDQASFLSEIEKPEWDLRVYRMNIEKFMCPAYKLLRVWEGFKH